MRTRRGKACLRRCCNCGDLILTNIARGWVVCEDCEARGVTVASVQAQIAREVEQAKSVAANCKGLLHGEMHGFGRKG